MLKTAFQQGEQAALKDFGVAAPDAAEPKKEPSFLSKALPWAVAAGTGLAAYKGLRTPSFSKNPALRALQQRGASKGFHRVVDVTHAPLPANASLANRAWAALQPRADAEGKLNFLNKAKLFLREGTTEAIPVANVGGKVRLVGRDGPMNVKGVVSERHNAVDGVENYESSAKLIRGGKDIEGDPATRRAATLLGQRGKAYEAALLQKHAPDAMPETHANLADLLKGVPMGTPKQQQRALGILKQKLQKQFGEQEYLLKQTKGVASSGKFPYGQDDWEKQLAAYNKHISNPQNAAALEAATDEGQNGLAHYLRDNKIHEGHVLNQMLTNPAEMIAQAKVENALPEWRVHSLAGSAPRNLMIPKGGGALDALKGLGAQAGLGPVDLDEMQKFVENTMKRLPPKHQNAQYGFDVLPFKNPEEPIGFKMLEMNPAENAISRGPYAGPGGGSGHLSAQGWPFMGHMHYRAGTGRHTPLLSGLGGLGAAGLAGGLTSALTPGQDPDEATQPSPTRPTPA